MPLSLSNIRVLEASEVPAAARASKFEMGPFIEILNFAHDQGTGKVIEIPLDAGENPKAIKAKFKRTISARPDGLKPEVVRAQWLKSEANVIRFKLGGEPKRRAPRKPKVVSPENTAEVTMTPVASNRSRTPVTA